MVGKNVYSYNCRLVAILAMLVMTMSLRAQEYPSLLWEISGNGLEQPSYIYGTVHSFDSKAFRVVPQLAPKITATEAFAMEMLLDMQSQNIAELLQFVTMPGDTTISMLLDSAAYARLSRYASDSAGLPIILLGKVKPFFLMAMMMESSMTQDAARFLDDSLAQIATNAQKKIIGIETMQEQLAAIDRIPLREQARMLMEEIDSAMSNPSKGQMDDLIGAYATGSLDSLYELFKKKEFSNAFQLALVTDRNHRMADRIASYLSNNMRMFVAIGALHLPGEEGVINLLRKRGFSVTPIRLN